MEKATFAAGCFWGVEAAIRNMPGVKATRVGYIGGHVDKPTYQNVCTGKTGHAEAVEVSYDAAVVSYEQLLNLFWQKHNPTTYHRQGPDVGSQYRSAIFFHSPEQEKEAQASKAALDSSGRFTKPVVTEVVPATTFYEAEDYHQQYLEKRGQATCKI